MAIYISYRSLSLYSVLSVSFSVYIFLYMYLCFCELSNWLYFFSIFLSIQNFRQFPLNNVTIIVFVMHRHNWFCLLICSYIIHIINIIYVCRLHPFHWTPPPINNNQKIKYVFDCSFWFDTHSLYIKIFVCIFITKSDKTHRQINMYVYIEINVFFLYIYYQSMYL